MDPVTRDIAVLPFDMGGLQIVDLEKKSQAIKMSSVAKMFYFITYEVIPKMLPSEAIRELLADTPKRVFKQHTTVLETIPKDWKDLLNTEIGKPDETFRIKVDTNTEPKLITQLNWNTLCNILLREDTSSVDHAYRTKWADTLGPVNWMKIFKNIQLIVKRMISDGKFCIGVFPLLRD